MTDTHFDPIDAALANVTPENPGSAVALADAMLTFDLSDPATKADLARPVALVAIVALTNHELWNRLTEPDALAWLARFASAE